jgi:hypothetical protein
VVRCHQEILARVLRDINVVTPVGFSPEPAAPPAPTTVGGRVFPAALLHRKPLAGIDALSITLQPLKPSFPLSDAVTSSGTLEHQLLSDHDLELIWRAYGVDDYRLFKLARLRQQKEYPTKRSREL